MRTKKEINIQIGERIRAARENNKITQEQLAEQIEVSPQYISDLERGVVGISLATLKKACLAMHISSDSILFGSPSDGLEAEIIEMLRSLEPTQARLLRDIIEKYVEAVKIKQN